MEGDQKQAVNRQQIPGFRRTVGRLKCGAHTNTHALESRNVEDSGSGGPTNSPCGGAACQLRPFEQARALTQILQSQIKIFAEASGETMEICVESGAAVSAASSRPPPNDVPELGPKSKVGAEYETTCRASLSNRDEKHIMTSTVDAEAYCPHDSIPSVCRRVSWRKQHRVLQFKMGAGYTMSASGNTPIREKGKGDL